MHVIYSVPPADRKPLFLPDRVVPEGTEPTDEPVVDSEFFIRKLFENNPQQGCELLFRQYYRPLCTHAARFVYAREIAEDLVADVFYTFWNTRAYAAVNTSYRAYLFRAVRNRTYNYLANELKPNDSLDLQDLPLVVASEEPESILRYDELHHRVGDLVESLPPQCRKVFILNRFEGRRAREIADELQLSVRTVETHIAKALSVLREGLRHYWLSGLLLIGSLWQNTQTL